MLKDVSLGCTSRPGPVPKGTAENAQGRKSWVYIPTGTSPEGTAENSPGRKSWVCIPTETSPEGTAENAPGRKSWVCPDRMRMLIGNHSKPNPFSLRPTRTW
jgi:hypothetical protein